MPALRPAAPLPPGPGPSATGRAAPRHPCGSGIVADGIHTFKGIPYGASTAGEARFLPPRPPAPWTGTRDATAFGAICSQTGALVDKGLGIRSVGNVEGDLESVFLKPTTTKKEAA